MCHQLALDHTRLEALLFFFKIKDDRVIQEVEGPRRQKIFLAQAVWLSG